MKHQLCWCGGDVTQQTVSGGIYPLVATKPDMFHETLGHFKPPHDVTHVMLDVTEHYQRSHYSSWSSCSSVVQHLAEKGPNAGCRQTPARGIRPPRALVCYQHLDPFDCPCGAAPLTHESD